MTYKHPHKKLPEKVCPKCGATEGVSRILNYYFCESCHKKEQEEKKVPASTAAKQ
jgi:transposase-like protein